MTSAVGRPGRAGRELTDVRAGHEARTGAMQHDRIDRRIGRELLHRCVDAAADRWPNRIDRWIVDNDHADASIDETCGPCPECSFTRRFLRCVVRRELRRVWPQRSQSTTPFASTRFAGCRCPVVRTRATRPLRAERHNSATARAERAAGAARDARRRISRTRPSVLVMGGTGTARRTTCCVELSGDRERMDIVAAARSETSAERLRTAGFATVTLDLDRNETLAPADAWRRYGLHAEAALDRLPDPEQTTRRAAVKARVRHVVNLGSYGADDTPWASIGWTGSSKAYLRVSGLEHTDVATEFFMDNVVARADRDAGRIVHYFGATPASWIAAADIARVAAEVCVARRISRVRCCRSPPRRARWTSRGAGVGRPG